MVVRTEKRELWRNSLTELWRGEFDRIYTENKDRDLRLMKSLLIEVWRERELEFKTRKLLSLRMNNGPRRLLKFAPRDRLSNGMVNMVCHMYRNT